MSTRKKLIFSIVSLVVTILAITTMTVAVFAAQNVTVTSNNITVNYTTSGIVSATVSATYTNGNTTPIDMTTTGEAGGATSILFTAGSTETTETLKTLTDNLNYDDNHQITFTYTFVNNGDASFTATVTLPTTQTNLTVSESARKTSPTPASDVTVTSHSFTVLGRATVTYTVVFTVEDLAQNAQLQGAFNWALAA